jgi:hypothetical protein
MSAPTDQGAPVDAIDVVRHLESILASTFHELAIARARIDKIEAENSELQRQARVREATSD